MLLRAVFLLAAALLTGAFETFLTTFFEAAALLSSGFFTTLVGCFFAASTFLAANASANTFFFIALANTGEIFVVSPAFMAAITLSISIIISLLGCNPSSAG